MKKWKMKGKLNIQRKHHLLCKGIHILFNTSGLYASTIILLNVISGLMAVLNLIAYQNLIDNLYKMVDAGEWLSRGLYSLVILLLLKFVAYVLNEVVDFIKQVFSDKVDLHITEEVLHKSIQLPMETFDKAEIYNHINVAVTRTSSCCLNLLESISEIIYSFVKAVSYLYIIWDFSWLVAVISILSMTPLLHISVEINKYWYQIYIKRMEKNRLIQYLKMLLVKNSCVKEIRLFNVGEKIIKFITCNFSDFIKEDQKARKNFLRKKTSVQFLDDVVTFGIKLWIVMFAVKAGSTLGTAILYYNALDDLKLSYNQLFKQLAVLQNSIQYLESLDILEHEEIADIKTENHFSGGFNVIEFRNVFFKYPGSDKYVLKNVSLKFKRGETYFVVGFNGSGKTTLIKLLLRLYQPTHGEILIDGVNIQTISLIEYYANISAIFQDFIQYPFDVYENVAIRAEKQDPSRVDEVLKYVGMLDFVNQLPNQKHTMLMRDWNGGIDLSQGQWQKLAIARCFYADSAISIFDEPFSSIDVEAENNIISNIRQHCRSNLMIFISHRFSSISLKDKIVVLKEGIVVEMGRHEELVKNKGMYYKLYESQKID